MYLSRIRISARDLIIAALAFLVLLLASCGFADLRSIGLTTTPAEPYQILPYANSSVILYFDTEMMVKETEGVLQILSPSGTVEGDLKWEGNGRVLHFIPASSWSKGLRYVLKISGNVYSRDGREFFISRDIPFYAMAKLPLPYLVSSYPADGASTEAFIPGESMLSLRFSLPMDRESTVAALSCDGLDQKNPDFIEHYIEWSDDDRVLSIRPANALYAWTVYKWSITEKALSRDGAPLARTASGRFITDQDEVFPEVVKIIPLYKSEDNAGLWGSWLPLDINLDNGLGPEQAIGVEFNKPMDIERLRSSFSFEPSLPGRVEIISPLNAIYIPDRNPEPETFYTLKISGEARDERGLKLGDDFTLVFMSDLPYLRVASLTFDEVPPLVIHEPLKAKLFAVQVDEAEGVMRFTIRFSLGFSALAQREGTPRITLAPFFPGTLGSLNLRFVRWLAPDLLRMEWEGVETGKPGEPHYYKLTIPGGRSGIANGDGSYFNDEIYFYLEAVKR